jgi:bifunctional NMN adenylyltransferase/nudix hydrolase
MTTEKRLDYAVFIGRFQPMHIGHEQVIQTALKLAETVIVVIGSANRSRTPKNPWTAQDRAAMIRSVFPDTKRVRIVQMNDQSSDQRWVAAVQEAVAQAKLSDGWKDRTDIAIIGHNKDESSYYLKMFPQWTLIDHDMDESVSATDLRKLYLEGKNLKFMQSLVPAAVYATLTVFKTTDTYTTLVDEFNFINQYKKAWDVAPYPPTFVTVDAVVVQSGHVLLIKRRAAPGKNTWALPGGFVNQSERLENAMIRELREETLLKVPDPVLRGNISVREVYDDPNRSERGRTITHAFGIQLPPGPLPKVTGSDDAVKAKWVPINDVFQGNIPFFEDHFFIIEDVLGKLP